MSQELGSFVRDALARGLAKDDIRSALRRAGWPEDAVEDALAHFADVDFPLPVPRPRPYVSAREAFVYLVTFSTLYASALGLGAVIFRFIETAWPDPADGPFALDRQLSSLRWSMSWLLIAFPVYMWLARRTSASLRREPGKRRSRIRKWLTYVTLFVAASVLVGDLVTLVFNLLGGELTPRFLLKVTTVAGIAGAVFGYYTLELRRDDMTPEELAAPRPLVLWLGVAATATVVAALVGGFVLVGTPQGARAERLDDRRESDLAAVAGAIDTYWSQESTLPADLETLARTRGAAIRSIRDPATAELYEYEPLGERSYRLCAIFDRVDRDDYATGPGAVRGSRFWTHGAGRHCFDVEVVDDD